MAEAGPNVVIFAALTLAAATAAPPAPVVCMSGECKPVATVAASDRARTFVWIDADRRRVVAGVLPAGSTTIAAGDAAVSHRLSLKTSDGGTPEIGFELRCGNSSWQWTLASLPARPLDIGRPIGDCTLNASAAGYKAATVPLTAEAVAAYVHRLPSLSVVVTDATMHTPIANAHVFKGVDELMGSTDEKGALKTLIEGPWPFALRIEAAGRAPRRVPVPKAVADTEIAVALSAGGSVAIALPELLSKEQLGWELRSEAGELVRSGRVPAGQTEIVAEALDPGRYVAVVMGEAPLQRIAVPLTVREGQASEAVVTLESAVLELEVRLGEQPLDAATVEMTFENGLWRSPVKTDGDGRVVEEIWQRGDYAAVVSRPPLVRFWREKRRLDHDGLGDWRISVPERRVRGVVKDQSTGAGIADATIDFRSATAEGLGAMLSGRSSPDGSFEFTAVPPGTYQLAVSKNGYVPVETQRITIGESVKLETRDVLMRQAAGRVVTVVDARRIPLVGAAIYVTSQNGTRIAGATDDGGRLELPIGTHEAGVAFAIPRSGSLGMARFVSLLEADSPDIIVRVPDGVAALELRAESTSGEAIPGVSVLIRIDGILLPPQVKEALSQYLGIARTTDAEGRLLFPRMPPGRFEIWPLASRADYDAVRSAAPPPAPVNVILTPGQQTARLTFEKKD